MEEQLFYDIYDFYYVPFWKQPYFIILIVCLSIFLAMLLSYFLFRLIRNRRNRGRELLPWEWAEEELARFDVSKFSSKGEFKRFSFSLTMIMKRYLGLRYNWRLEDKTDEEIEEFLSLSNFDPLLAKEFVGLLKSSLLVKFADEAALSSQAKQDLEVARKIIKKTKIFSDGFAS